MALKSWHSLSLCSLMVACVAKSPASTGGFQLNPTSGMCPAGYAVSNSDYTSTNISALGPTGEVLSQSVISSGSAPPGLTTALSGDVVFPSSAAASGKMVLIDRYPNSVLTWVEPSTGAVIRQLPVGTGFAANPHDYLELTAHKAYVSRYESNPKPGQVPFDDGGDLLIVDPGANEITGRVELASAQDGDFLPRADHILLVGREVWVSLHRFDADFKTAGDARLIGVDSETDAILWMLDIPGVANCGGVSRSPSGKVVALSCSGVFGDSDPTSRSAIILLDATQSPPVVLQKFDSTGAPLGGALAFASETLLVGVALGDFGRQRADRAFTLDTALGGAQTLLDAGAPFALGDVQCAPGCTDLCFLADAKANAIHVWQASGSTLQELPAIVGDTSVGLPPRGLGAL